MNKNIAVILSGSGFLDGTEVSEAVLTFLALDTEGASYEVFAPDIMQHHVVNHLTGTEQSAEQRNVLVESARISRGKVTDLLKLDSSKFDGLILPGGFGAAKNLSNFALKGSLGNVDADLLDIIKDFKASKKPIGAMCIAPVLIAMSVGKTNPKLTIGEDKETAIEIEKLGGLHHECSVENCIVDCDNKIISTPAYMYADADLSDVYMGIHKTVKNVLAMVK